MRICKIIAASVLLMLLSSSQINAQQHGESPFIYQIASSGCEYEPNNRTLTGFRVKGVSGIITALHGVAGCTSFNAVSRASGTPSLSSLEIAAIDIDHDLALLRPFGASQQLSDSEGLDAAPAGALAGVAASVTVTTTLRPQAYIVGHSYARNYQDRNDLGIRGQRVLREILASPSEDSNLGSSLLAALDTRLSPNPDWVVLDLQGVIVPGMSGAPVFDSNNKVLGIGNGGLLGGATGYSWAIPWSENICWQPIKALEQSRLFDENCGYTPLQFSNRYDRVLKNNPSDIYAFPQSGEVAERLQLESSEWLQLEVMIRQGDQSVTLAQPVSLHEQSSYLLPFPPEMDMVGASIIIRNQDSVSKEVLAIGQLNSGVSTLFTCGTDFMFQVINLVGSPLLRVTPLHQPTPGPSLVVRGCVYDADTQRPIVGATVKVKVDSLLAIGETIRLATGRTTSNGFYVLPGINSHFSGWWVTVIVEADGYRDESIIVALSNDPMPAFYLERTEEEMDDEAILWETNWHTLKECCGVASSSSPAEDGSRSWTNREGFLAMLGALDFSLDQDLEMKRQQLIGIIHRTPGPQETVWNLNYTTEIRMLEVEIRREVRNHAIKSGVNIGNEPTR